MRALIGAVLIALVILSRGFSADLKTYQDTYEKKLGDIVLETSIQCAGVASNYMSGLTKLQAAVQQAGDLDKIKAVKTEAERFAREKTVRLDSARPALAEIRALQAAYARDFARIETDKATRVVSMAKQYDVALERLQKELARTNRLDEATAVQEARKRAAASDEVAKAMLALNPAAAATEKPAPVKAPEEPAPAKAADDQKRQEEVAVTLYCDDGCEFYHNGQRIDFSYGADIKLTVTEGDVFAFKCTDMQGGQACGLIVGVRIASNRKMMVSDTTWIASNVEESGWEEQEFKDSKWKRVKLSRLESMQDVARTAARNWKAKPFVIWGEGSPVYIRKHIRFSEFK